MQAVDSVLHLSARCAPVVVETILTDTDGRGLPDRWQMRHFGTLGVDPNADPDGDGLTNLEEYRRGTDPRDYFNGVEPILKPLYGSTEGPEGQLAMIILHPDGTPWVNANAHFNLTSGTRRMSLVRNKPPYISEGCVRTDQNGMAQIFLEPLHKPDGPDLPAATPAPSRTPGRP